MGEHSRDKVMYGAMIARGEDDRMIGFQAYRIERGARKGDGKRSVVGEVRENITDATRDAIAAFDKEFPPK